MRLIDADDLNGYELGLISPKAQKLFHKIIDDAPTIDIQSKQSFEGMTNGEVIKVLFPNGKVIERDEAVGYEQMLDDKYSYCSWFDGLWWNTPYKESEVQDADSN